jgi:acyl-coenzyme A thioesterase PaaI-like protein
MIFSEKLGRIFLNWYPPFILNRIKIVSIKEGFKGCRVKIKKSFLNRNMNGTIFGGALFSASDPFYAILYWQIFERKGYKIQTWLKSAEIHYLRPANQSLYLDFEVTNEQILEAEESLNSIGKYKHTHEVRYKSKDGDIYVIAKTEVYLRLTRASQKPLSGF